MFKTVKKCRVRFFYPYKARYIKESGRLKKFIERIFMEERKKLESLNYVFCSDKDLLKINKRYLNHNYYTDIVTFDLSEKAEVVQGESYISIDRVRANAKRLNVPFRNELLRVVFHGALHLCTYNDKTKKDIRIIRKKEDYYLSLYLNH
jgi:probable rRNA maturation factor